MAEDYGLTVQKLNDLKTQLENYYGTRNSWCEEYEKLYLGEKGNIWLEDPRAEEERITLPTGYTTIEMATGLTASRPPSISVPPCGRRKIDEAKADKLEKFLYAMWDQAGLFRAFRDMGWNFFAYGWTVPRVTWDADALKADEFPIVFQTVYPRDVYPKFDFRDRLRYVFFIETTDIGTIRTQWGEDLFPGKSDDTAVDLIDYWEVRREKGKKPAVINAVYIDAASAAGAGTDDGPAGDSSDQWVKPPAKTRYPDIPYRIHRNLQIPIPNKGQYEGTGILFPIAFDTGLARYRNRLMSQMAQVIADFADPITIIKTDEVAADGEGRPIFPWDRNHGAVNFLRGEEEAGFLQWQGTPPAVFNHWQVTEQELEKSTFPSALFGQYEADISGVALSALQSPTMSKLASWQYGLRKALEDVLSYALQLAESFMPRDGLPFWVEKVDSYEEEVLKKDDIGGYHNVVCRLSADLPKDVPGMLAVISNLRSTDLLSQQTGIDLLQQYLQTRIQSPEQEMERILQEKVISTPEVQKALGLEAIREWSPQVYALTLQAMMPPQPQGMEGGQGGIPPMEPPGLGVPPTVMPIQGAPFAGSVEAGLGATGMPAPPGAPMGVSGAPPLMPPGA